MNVCQRHQNNKDKCSHRWAVLLARHGQRGFQTSNGTHSGSTTPIRTSWLGRPNWAALQSRYDST